MENIQETQNQDQKLVNCFILVSDSGKLWQSHKFKEATIMTEQQTQSNPPKSLQELLEVTRKHPHFVPSDQQRLHDLIIRLGRDDPLRPSVYAEPQRVSVLDKLRGCVKAFAKSIFKS